MLVTAKRPLPTLGRTEGETFDLPPRAAQRLIGKGIVARAVQPPRRLSDAPNRGPLTGSCAWFPDWTGQTCVIVASGASAAGAPLALARMRARVLVINESWRLAPWADVLYACDSAWWMLRAGAPEFAGLKVTQDVTAAKAWGLQRVSLTPGRDEILTAEAGVIGWGGNSGFQAVNLAVQFGAARIILVGFDLNLAGGSHWHGRHPSRLNNPTEKNLARWAAVLDGQAAALADLGVDVVNTSPASSLGAFRKLSLEEALGL